MTQNPFDALGGGGFDVNALLQQAQQMQQDLVAAQDRLKETTVDGTVAGGAVTVRITGDGELTAVEIKAGEFDGNEPDELADLGDMVVAAFRDAKAKADALAAEALGPLAGGLGAPGGVEPGQPGQPGQPPQLGF